MINGTQIFSYIEKKVGVNQDGEKYLALNVLSKNNKKFSFLVKNTDLIDKISQLNFTKFQDIKLHFDFDREYNREKKTAYWTCEVIGVG